MSDGVYALQRRVDAALGAGRDTPPDRAGTTVLLVGAGSADAADNAEVARTARLLWEAGGFADVETAFLATAVPDVPAGLERCARLGARRIVLLTCLSGEPGAQERVGRQADGWAGAHPGVEVRHAPPGDGGPTPREPCTGIGTVPTDTGGGDPCLRHPGDAASTRPQPRPHEADAAPTRPAPGDDHDLGHHGDAEVRDADGDLVDLAVNVRAGTPPRWLRERLAATFDGLAGYPDDRAAHRAVAARHGRPVEEVLLTAGAAEAFVLLARTTRARQAVVVHPQFTEPEAALRNAGHPVHRVLLRAEDGFRLDPRAVPETADLVVVGNPTNPTSVLHPAAALARLARPGRTLVVDEAFMDAVPGEPESLAARRDLPGLVVLRSLTKTWGLAGLRVGYVLGDREHVAALRRAQPLWAVSAPGLTAVEACCAPEALAEAAEAARRTTAHREHLLGRLAEFGDVEVAGPAQGPFVLLRLPGAALVRARLRELGFAVRRADTFPGLSPEWLRLAVRDPATSDRFAAALSKALAG